MTENSLPKRSSQSQDQRSTLSNIAALVGAGAMGMLGLAGFAHADEAEHGLQAPSYPWSHSGWFSSYDHASLVSFLCIGCIRRISRFCIVQAIILVSEESASSKAC